MQTVASGWTAEERDATRQIAQSTRVSWHKYDIRSAHVFTIGVSLIGGPDYILLVNGAVGSASNYAYFDESNYVQSLNYERGLNMPLGGFTMAMADITLDNTSGRFTPRYLGGNSELYTAILPTRPLLISAGFNYNGIDQTLPQFAGQFVDKPAIDLREKTLTAKAFDYNNYFSDKYLDNQSMFTSQRVDQILTTMFTTLGMTTAQYDLDTGINTIPFGIFEKGTKYSDLINDLVQAENGHCYQDESGVFKFENREHWAASPFTNVQRIVLTGQVIDSFAPDDDHLINVVEITSSIIEKQPHKLIYSLSGSTFLSNTVDTTIFIDFDNPILQADTPYFWKANAAETGDGEDLSSHISLKSFTLFAKAAKLVFTNSASSGAYLNELNIFGRAAVKTSDLYYREQDDSSVTAYQEHPIQIDNPYIQDRNWAATYARMILNDFSEVEKVQRIIIRALPELQLGDLVSWQGRYWRIYDIKTTIDPSVGFIQELTLLQRTITKYFRVGVSTIQGTDPISP